MYAVRGLRQALVMLVAAGLVALGLAGLWILVQGGDFRRTTGVALMLLAALLGFTGGSVVSRSGTNDALAFLGRGPDREERASGPSLTGVGVFLFVSIPLFLVGGFLYG
jgi:hypothetical protein